MQRKPLVRKDLEAKGPRHRRPDAGIPEVPTFHPDANGAVMQAPPAATTDEDPTEEAVRRMVEAAYT
jgi:hypothetical protein